jgi:hypothetical protein
MPILEGGVGRIGRSSRVGKQAFAEGENVRNRGFLRSEAKPEGRSSRRREGAERRMGLRL